MLVESEFGEEPTEPDTLKSSGSYSIVGPDKLSFQYLRVNNLGTVQANKPASPNYFEIFIDRGAEGQIAIGFAAPGFNLRRQPGSDLNSYEYRGDDGFLYCRDGKAKPFGPTYTTDDIVGAGYNYFAKEFFFTKNGSIVGTEPEDVKGPLYPTIAVYSENEQVTVNFGENPFVFDLKMFEAEQRTKQQVTVYKIPIPRNANYGFSGVITSWEKGKLLGHGSFGLVYEGIAANGFFFAVKEVSLLDQGEKGRQSIYQLEQEIALLSQFEHENIVRYYGTGRDDSKLYIFLELVKESLLNLYHNYNLRDSHASAYTRQLLHGLKYLHNRNVVHRDIKCANILVDANGSVKLADFGLAKAIRLNDVKSCKGTPFWMAPEVVNASTQGYGLAADIWSLGCAVLEMLTGQFPYSGLEPMAAVYRIGRGERPCIPETLSGDARDFILKCLQVDPFARPTAAQLLDHSFVKRPFSESYSASPYHPSRRV